jgi:hypothetical protein
MKRTALTGLVFLLAILAGRLGTAQADGSKPELIVDVDVNDEVWLRRQNMTEQDVADLVTKLKQNGCQTLLIRCGCLGFLPYRTELSYPLGFDAKHARANPVPAVIPNMEVEIAQSTVWNKRYAEVIRDINPPAVFIREAHKQGMKAIAWIDIFDDGWPGFHSKFLDEHPYCQWVGKDGKTYFKGLTDYSWPEARAFRVAEARELLDLGADGVHCSTSAHCRHLPNTHDEDFYGYSRPIVKAFQAKYGVDIRTAKDFDKSAWHDLKGEAMVQLYRDLARLCHSRRKELWIGLQLGRYTQFAVDPHFSTNVVARFTNHWKTLVDERVADAFIVGDYELASSPAQACWRTKKDIQLRSGEDLYAWAAREYKAYCQGKTRLYLFSEWAPNGLPKLEARTRSLANLVLTHGFDGVDMHEAWDFEQTPATLALLRSMAERFQGGAPSPHVLPALKEENRAGPR